MHTLGDVVMARQIDRADGGGSGRFIWHACADCGKQRWVKLINGEPRSQRCHRCGRARHKRGYRIHPLGYIRVKVEPNNFFYPMATKGGHVRGHRLAMAIHLGRCLHPWEVVHHKDGDRRNNDIDNLELATVSTHATDHNKGYRDGYQKGIRDGRASQVKCLRARVQELEARLALLDAS